jgi:uncharacterized protein (DUF2235 family)
MVPGDRNFIISIDGTGNSPEDAHERGSDTTNVHRFHAAIDREDENQLACYFPGVGTTQQHQSEFGLPFGKAFGAGARRLRDHAYATFVRHYQPGDRVFIMGFSRGAAIARMLCNTIREQGIPQSITITRDEDLRFVSYENHGRQKSVSIEMLGVWDTVAALGVPIDIGRIPFQKINLFTDLTIASNIKRAYHLVSVDEQRKAFEPTLMNYDPRRVEEIWFPGDHADVGGGHDLRRLADAPLEFMIDKARRLGVRFHREALDEIQPNPNGLGVLHTKEDRLFHYGLKPRILKVMRNGKPDRKVRIKLHESILNRTAALGAERYNPKNVRSAMKRPFEIVKRDILEWDAEV